MRIIKLSLIALLPLCSSMLSAQTVLANDDTWNESHINALDNIEYTSTNPVAISYNKIKKFGVARVSYNYATGEFRKPDSPKKDRHLGVHISGLQSVGKFDLSGSFSYDNASRIDSRWNSTLGLNEYNPFILADSVFSDQTVETFDMNAKGVFNINNRWKTALSISFTSARMSDQTDPRPETSMSNFPVTLGGEYALTDKISLGAALNACIYRSDIDYTLINPLNYYQYFLFKGTGDYYRRSSADVSGYDREYKGSSYGGSLQMKYDISESIHNFLDLGYYTGSENATDEGSTPFKGGDYDYGKMTLSDRFMLRNERTVHNIILSMTYANGEGKWYDQKKMIDTEHGNRMYYDILSKYKIFSNDNIRASVEYSFATLNAEGNRDLYVDFVAGMQNVTNKNYYSGVKSQKGTTLDFDLAVGKGFGIADKVGIDAIIRGGYHFPLSTTFADASTLLNENLVEQYSGPMYQYTFAKAFNLGVHVDVHMPVNRIITCGLTFDAKYLRCIDDCQYAISYKSTDRSRINASVYLKF